MAKPSVIAMRAAQAQEAQAEGVKGLQSSIRRLEKKLDEVLALLAPAETTEAPAADEPKAAKTAKTRE
jgi:hypothetical protein